MSVDTIQMLNDSLDALVSADAALASDVCARDGSVDSSKRQIRQAAIAQIRHDPESTDYLLTLLAAARNLERIADTRHEHRRRRDLHDRRPASSATTGPPPRRRPPPLSLADL